MPLLHYFLRRLQQLPINEALWCGYPCPQRIVLTERVFFTWVSIRRRYAANELACRSCPDKRTSGCHGSRKRIVWSQFCNNVLLAYWYAKSSLLAVRLVAQMTYLGLNKSWCIAPLFTPAYSVRTGLSLRQFNKNAHQRPRYKCPNQMHDQQFFSSVELLQSLKQGRGMIRRALRINHLMGVRIDVAKTAGSGSKRCQHIDAEPQSREQHSTAL